MYKFNGEKVRALRAFRGLTQPELGLEIGLSAVQILNIEKGVHTPHSETLKKIADFFDTKMEYFFDAVKDWNIPRFTNFDVIPNCGFDV